MLLAYRYLGLVENKIKRKETEVLEKFFKELNVQISIDDKGNLVYNKMYFLTNFYIFLLGIYRNLFYLCKVKMRKV